MVGTRLENGQLQNSSSGNTMGSERLQEKARTTEEELVARHQTRPQKYGLDVGRSRDNGERQRTKQNGVDVWPNAAFWMRDELRSKVR